MGLRAVDWYQAAQNRGWEFSIGRNALFLDGASSKDAARQFIALFAKSLALVAHKMEAEYFQVRYPGCTQNSCRVPAIFASQGDNMTAIQIPGNLIWLGGRVELTRTLYNALGEMLDSDRPQGLVTADTSIQVWINPASVQLFQLTSIEEAVPRDTTRDWQPADLDRKRQLIRDAGDRPFEIDYLTQVGDGSWKRLTNQYRLIDNKYLIGTNLGSEIAIAPQESAL